MSTRTRTTIGAVGLLVGALVAPIVGATPAAAAPEGSEGLYTPMTPCRIIDTRFSDAGKLASQEQRSFQIRDTKFDFGSQGGSAEGCGVPEGADAVEISVTATATNGGGYLRAWPGDSPEPTATILNFSSGQNITNTGTVTLTREVLPQRAPDPDVIFKSYGGPAHYVVDIQGYFGGDPQDELRIGIMTTPASYIPLRPCRVVDTRFGGGGKLDSQDERTWFIRDTKDGFANQGGLARDCGVPIDAVAVEASVSAVSPASSGYFRAWPAGQNEPNATFINFTDGQATTNTGTLTLSDLTVRERYADLTVKNYGGPTHFVIDVQGYFVPPEGVDVKEVAQERGTRYFAQEPCRIVDTRFGGGGKFASQDQRGFSARNKGVISEQGGAQHGCGIPFNAVAIEASISAVAPSGGGYFRSWPSTEEPNATILNFSSQRATTNTGTITLNTLNAKVGAVAADFQAKSYGGPVHYVIDVQGYYLSTVVGNE